MQGCRLILEMCDYLSKLFLLTAIPSQSLLHVVISLYQLLNLGGIRFQIYVFLLLELLTHLLGLQYAFLQLLDKTRDSMDHGMESLVHLGNGMG